mmetsp:Transcript_32180/g.74063  ORF Transcript_32180/g.74063 Transcript_32180/m.74063 type:complete len:91 (+) Transcript_32180:192-464(+)
MLSQRLLLLLTASLSVSYLFSALPSSLVAGDSVEISTDGSVHPHRKPVGVGHATNGEDEFADLLSAEGSDSATDSGLGQEHRVEVRYCTS